VLLAAAAFPAALLLAAAGQGLGATLAGCRWLGVAVPLDRQVWALVEEPVVRFAALARAWPYWLGSLLLPAAVAGLAIPLLPRPRSLAAELATLQAAWAAAVAALAVEPLLDRTDGHLVRFLQFRGLDPRLAWGVPALAAVLAAPAALRLLALAREGRPRPTRAQRVGVVLLHLAAPAAAWAATVALAGGAPARPAAAAAGGPVAVALALAWRGFPPRLPHRFRPPSWRSAVAASLAAAAAWAAVAVAGRPLPDGRRAGVLWAETGPRNNVRPWIAARTLPWTTRGRGR